MNGRLVVRPRADADLDECADYLAQRNPRAARRFVAAARQTCERIAEMPEAGGLAHPRRRVLHSARHIDESLFQ
jgi:plasmid stabilization system protein ParE